MVLMPLSTICQLYHDGQFIGGGDRITEENIVGWYYRLANRQTSGESASLPQYLGCNTVFDMRLRVTFLRQKTASLQSNIAHRE